MTRKRIRVTKRLLSRPDMQVRFTCLGPDLIHDVVALVSDGITPGDAATLLGITESTHRRYMSSGAKYVSDLEADVQIDKKDQLAGVYFMEVKKAEARFRKRVVIRSLTPDYFTETWVRDITVLERRDPSNWGKRVPDPIINDHQYQPDEQFI